MSSWRKDELKKIADADDLHISPFREDGMTYGTPTWIWSVVVDDSLYVRAYNGTASRWYKAAMQQKRGQITAAGVTKNVAFEPVDGPINDDVDEAPSCVAEDAYEKRDPVVARAVLLVKVSNDRHCSARYSTHRKNGQTLASYVHHSPTIAKMEAGSLRSGRISQA
jgi:hypothetical protein